MALAGRGIQMENELVINDYVTTSGESNPGSRGNL